MDSAEEAAPTPEEEQVAEEEVEDAFATLDDSLKEVDNIEAQRSTTKDVRPFTLAAAPLALLPQGNSAPAAASGGDAAAVGSKMHECVFHASGGLLLPHVHVPSHVLASLPSPPSTRRSAPLPPAASAHDSARATPTEEADAAAMAVEAGPSAAANDDNDCGMPDFDDGDDSWQEALDAPAPPVNPADAMATEEVEVSRDQITSLSFASNKLGSQTAPHLLKEVLWGERAPCVLQYLDLHDNVKLAAHGLTFAIRRNESLTSLDIRGIPSANIDSVFTSIGSLLLQEECQFHLGFLSCDAFRVLTDQAELVLNGAVPERTAAVMLQVAVRASTVRRATMRVRTYFTGTRPTGATRTHPTGTRPTGTRPTGTHATGTRPTGARPTGTHATGTRPTGAPSVAAPADAVPTHAAHLFARRLFRLRTGACVIRAGPRRIW